MPTEKFRLEIELDGRTVVASATKIDKSLKGTADSTKKAKAEAADFTAGFTKGLIAIGAALASIQLLKWLKSVSQFALKNARTAQVFEAAQSRLSFAIKRAAGAMGDAMIPALVRFLDLVTKIVSQRAVLEYFEFLGQIIAKVANSITTMLSKALEGLKTLFLDVGVALRRASDLLLKHDLITDDAAETMWAYGMALSEIGVRIGEVDKTQLKWDSTLETTTKSVAKTTKAVDENAKAWERFDAVAQRIIRRLDEFRSAIIAQMEAAQEAVKTTDLIAEGMANFDADFKPSGWTVEPFETYGKMASGAFADTFSKVGLAVIQGHSPTWEDALTDLGANLGATFGAAFGGAAGAIIGEVLGAAIGKLVGGLIDKLFGGGDKATGRVIIGGIKAGGSGGSGGGADVFNADQGGANQLGQGIKLLQDVMQHFNQTLIEVAEMLGTSITLLEGITLTTMRSGKVIVETTTGLKETFASLDEAMDWALKFLLQAADLGDAALAAQEVIASGATFAEIQENLRFLNSFGQTLTEIGSSARQAGAAIKQQMRAFDILRQQIMDMGLSAEAAAPLLAKLTQEQGRLRAELENNVLGKLAAVARQLGVSSAFVIEVEKARIKIEFALIRAQLMALDLWAKYADVFHFLQNAALAAAGAVNHLAGAITSLGGTVSSSISSTIGEIDSTIRKSGLKGEKKRAFEAFMASLARLRGAGRILNPIEQLFEDYRELLKEAQSLKGKKKRKKALIALEKEFQLAFERVIKALKEPLKDFLKELTLSDLAPTKLKDKFQAAGAEFFRLLGLARQGDVSAIQQLEAAARTYLQFAGQFLGTAGAQYRTIYDTVIRGIQSVIDTEFTTEMMDPLVKATQTQTEVLHGELIKISTHGQVSEEWLAYIAELMEKAGGIKTQLPLGGQEAF